MTGSVVKPRNLLAEIRDLLVEVRDLLRASNDERRVEAQRVPNVVRQLAQGATAGVAAGRWADVPTSAGRGDSLGGVEQAGVEVHPPTVPPTAPNDQP